MSYLDHSGAADSLNALFVDLDLVIETPSKKIIRGNQREDDTEERFSTNERIIFDKNEIESGTYKILW